MKTEIKVPVLPESVADATIAGWYKKPGERINEDEVLVDLETDKVILEVPVVNAGVVKEILFAVGDTVTAGQVLAIIDEAVDESSEDSVSSGTDENKAVAAVSIAAMSPSVRKLISENVIDETQLVGSGKNGRILKQDVENYLKNRRTGAGSAETSSAHVQEKAKAGVILPETDRKEAKGEVLSATDRVQRRVPMTRLRARIAERLVQSQQQAAILTTFNEVNMKPVMDIRARYKESFEKKYGVRLGFMSFFVQACVEALKRFPEINASIDGNDIVYHGFYDIGVAVSGPNGLVVPVLRDADVQTISEIEQSIVNYAVKARDNKLAIEDITGGTFTISNGGVFGSMLSTPILNPPQSAILGMHNITERAMVVDGEIVILPMMYLALSYDHRLVDGKSAVQFLVTVKQLLEDPSRILLGV
ncbi:MAG: 2-oxoglutarate dehydrogenase complex dihydrolipoyllysine-residue succinyltransferase [Proteobacteria bacterium]|nr:2-oxoglutarate dehydrogenase complex dihydrolipoyllysine-residue succinyltransferase [Pseudomonadota bacterium]